eukprot:7270942-Prymnesium_polylepis.1
MKDERALSRAAAGCDGAAWPPTTKLCPAVVIYVPARHAARRSWAPVSSSAFGTDTSHRSEVLQIAVSSRASCRSGRAVKYWYRLVIGER